MPLSLVVFIFKLFIICMALRPNSVLFDPESTKATRACPCILIFKYLRGGNSSGLNGTYDSMILVVFSRGS